MLMLNSSSNHNKPIKEFYVTTSKIEPANESISLRNKEVKNLEEGLKKKEISIMSLEPS